MTKWIKRVLESPLLLVFLFLVLIIVFSFVATFVDSLRVPQTTPLTLEEFNQIKKGMTRDDVIKILGSTGMPRRKSKGISGIDLDSFVWERPPHRGVIVVHFMQDTVVVISQSGLK